MTRITYGTRMPGVHQSEGAATKHHCGTAYYCPVCRHQHLRAVVPASLANDLERDFAEVYGRALALVKQYEPLPKRAWPPGLRALADAVREMRA